MLSLSNKMGEVGGGLGGGLRLGKVRGDVAAMLEVEGIYQDFLEGQARLSLSLSLSLSVSLSLSLSLSLRSRTHVNETGSCAQSVSLPYLPSFPPLVSGSDKNIYLYIYIS